jgi:hypothetical protein
VTASARPQRPGGRFDLILGSVLALGLFLIGVLAAGGTELTANTWVQVVLVVLAVGLGMAWLLKGATGPRWGAGALLAVAALAALTYASIAWSVQPATSWLEANRTLSYFGAFVAAVALARLIPGRWAAVVGAVATATTALCAYALLIKVFPGAFDRRAQLGRLIQPLDYWNAVGLTAALGLPACLWAGARHEGSRWSRALAPPAIAVLIGALLLSFSRGALIIAVIGAVCWFALVPLRLRGALVLGIGVVGGAVISAWALPSRALTADYVPLAQRISAGRWLGLVILLVLAACAFAGWVAADRMERVVLTAPVRRRVILGLVGLLALLPLGGIAALAASQRGLTGQISHVWNSLTNTRGGTGDQPGRLVQLSNSRPHYWSEGFAVAGHRLVVGTGALGFATANLRYSTDSQPVGHAHSFLVETLADFGLLGLAVSLALLVAWAVAAVRPLRAPPDPRYRAERAGMLTLFCVVVIFGLHSLIDWTWFIPSTAVIALVCAGWLAGRGPLATTVGWAAERRRLGASPLLGLGLVALTAATVFAGWVVLAPMRSADADSAAVSALLRGNPGAALTAARSAAAGDPVSVDPLFLLSQIYAAERNPGQARAELVKASSVQPGNPATWRQLGDYDLAQHQPATAVPELIRAHTLRPGSPQLTAELQQAQAAAAQAQKQAAAVPQPSPAPGAEPHSAAPAQVPGAQTPAP